LVHPLEFLPELIKWLHAFVWIACAHEYDLAFFTVPANNVDFDSPVVPIATVDFSHVTFSAWLLK
jgi:hypothetical protein